MKIHSSLRKAFSLGSIAFAVLVSLAVRGQAQQDPSQVEDKVNDILAQMSDEEKFSYISGTGFPNPIGAFNIKPIERLGLPLIYGIDGSLGFTGQGLPPGTRFPAGQLIASTWSADLAHELGVAVGQEVRSRGAHRILGPGVNFYRIPFYGRSFEYITGEDPFLGAVLVAAEVNGIQAKGVMATTKHYVVNDAEVNRFFVDSVVDERTLREIYLPPFEAAVKLANTAAIMGALNKVNGDFACESDFLVTEVLKENWGFRGFIESDFAAIHDGLKAALVGMDIEMPGGVTIVDGNPFSTIPVGQMTRENLGPAIPNPLPRENVDEKVRRLLRGIISYNFIDRPPVSDPEAIENATKKAKKVAITAAREGIVLLKNEENFLPLNRRSIRSIAVIGANAEGEPRSGGGSAAVPASTDFISEIDGIKSLAKEGAIVDYIAACVPNPSTAVWESGLGSEGLVGQYYNSPDLSGSPVATRVDTRLNFASFSASNVPVSNPRKFSGVWTGKVTPTINGDHVFKVSSGGNVRLYVDNQLILDDTSPVGTPDTPLAATGPWVPISGKINLQAGVAYDVRLEATNLGTFRLFGAAGLQVSWASLQPPADLANYDAVVLAVGGDEQYDGEGHDRSFRLPEFQDDLILNAVGLNPRTIVILHGGGGFDVQEWISQVPALLHAWFIGQYGGQPLAEILFGEVNPSGKLPITMEKNVGDNPAFASFPLNDEEAEEINYSEGLLVGYRGYEKKGIKPQYPFGFGLSYTKFHYSDLEIDPALLMKNFGDDDLIQVSFRVRNTGRRAGAEIAQIYVAPVSPPVERPLKELKGFEKVYLEPGQSRKVTIRLDRRSLAYYNANKGTWDVAQGAYRILVGSSSQDIRLQKRLENVPASSLSVADSVPVPGPWNTPKASKRRGKHSDDRNRSRGAYLKGQQR
ncbi:MAG TPA: glycoside hydrolase family 3 C-terminal domain-containing protein [Terrimicrobiaceae bacterium]